MDDFYKEDGPVEELLAAFERGRKVLTAPSSRGQTVYLDSDGNQVRGTSTT